MDSEFKLKRFQTDIKSAQGAMAMSLVLTIIYIVRALITKNLNFYFSLYTVEFLIKSSDFAPGFRGSLPGAAAAAGIVAFIAVSVVFTVLSQKNPVFLYSCLAVYGFDSLFMLAGKFSGYFSPVVAEDYIDIIVHAFILVFLIIGTVSYQKMKKTESEKTE